MNRTEKGQEMLWNRRTVVAAGAAGVALAGCVTVRAAAPIAAADSDPAYAKTNSRPPPFHRTPEERFANLAGFPFAPRYAFVDGLRVHYLDEGRGDRGTLLLLHGEPTWSFLYRNLIPTFVAAGYRIIAPDMVGFGRSDKATQESWYTLDAHVRVLGQLIDQLALRDIILVCQDWGGPYGLINAAERPHLIARLVILNTWLHHDKYHYTDALRAWNQRAPSVDFSQLGELPFLGGPDSAEVVRAGYRAPFEGPATQAGARRWPWMLPFANPVEGGAQRQAKAYAALSKWPKPAHVIFGDRDKVFNVEWGRAFADHIPGSTFDTVPAGHMVQELGVPLAQLILRRI